MSAGSWPGITIYGSQFVLSRTGCCTCLWDTAQTEPRRSDTVRNCISQQLNLRLHPMLYSQSQTPSNPFAQTKELSTSFSYKIPVHRLFWNPGTLFPQSRPGEDDKGIELPTVLWHKLTRGYCNEMVTGGFQRAHPGQEAIKSVQGSIVYIINPGLN